MPYFGECQIGRLDSLAQPMLLNEVGREYLFDYIDDMKS